MKWEPIALMILLLALGAWLVGGPGREGEPVRFGTLRGNMVIDRSVPDAWSYTVNRDIGESRTYSEPQLRELFGAATVEKLNASESNALFKLFNITGWGSLAWVAIGFAGQIAFFGRMAVQWVVSERKKQSVVPDVFWYLSLIGGVMLFTYFVWRQDFVGVLGQSSGIVIYARNIRLIYKKRHRDARHAARRAAAADTESGGGGGDDTDNPDEPRSRAIHADSPPPDPVPPPVRPPPPSAPEPVDRS